jgi:hypothetical protein
MDDAQFWTIIAKLDWKKAGDDDAVLRPAVKALAKLPPAEITAFDDMLAAKLFALDGLAWAREIGEESYRRPGEYFSGEAFLFARCRAVALGRERYEATLADPARMPKNEAFEGLLELAARAFELATSDDYTHVSTPDCETFTNEAGWPRND